MDTTEPREESALQAAKAGRTKFISHPCKKCGGLLRYTSSRACIPCAIAKATAYQNEIRDSLRKANGKVKGKGKAKGSAKAEVKTQVPEISPVVATPVVQPACDDLKDKAKAKPEASVPYNSINTTTSTKENTKIQKPEGVSDTVWSDWLSHRKARRSMVTDNVIAVMQREAKLAGWTLEQAMTESVMRGWQGFKAEWVKARASTARTFTEVEYRDGDL